jgi:ketosteroid isomerase-like protein
MSVTRGNGVVMAPIQARTVDWSPTSGDDGSPALWPALHGVDQLIEWNEAFVGSFSDRQFDSLTAHETADAAIDQGDFIGTHTKPLVLPDGQSVPPTGRQIRIRSADVATVKDGRIVRHDFYFDQMDMLGQLGLVEAPAASPS